MYAIVETGGKQYRVRPGDTIAVERLAGAPGETLDLDRVLLLGGDGAETRVGAPGVSGAIVRAEVVEHALGEKIVIFRYKSKVRYRRKTGHRQPLTRLRITDILLDGASAVQSTTAVVAEPEPLAESEAEPAPRRRRAATAVAEPPAEPAEPAEETDMPSAAAEAGPAAEEEE
jgi:large subunit ribosomal protein L21